MAAKSMSSSPAHANVFAQAKSMSSSPAHANAFAQWFAQGCGTPAEISQAFDNMVRDLGLEAKQTQVKQSQVRRPATTSCQAMTTLPANLAGAEGETVTGRSAKRQRQRARRRMGRMERSAQPTSCSESVAEMSEAQYEGDSTGGDLTDTTACCSLDELPSCSFEDAASSEEAEEEQQRGGSHQSVLGSAEALVPMWDKYNISVEVVEEKPLVEAPPLSQAMFGTSPEFEEFRAAYRQFRLGSGFGAKGEPEASTNISPKYDESRSGPWQQMSFWTSLKDSVSQVPADVCVDEL